MRVVKHSKGDKFGCVQIKGKACKNQTTSILIDTFLCKTHRKVSVAVQGVYICMSLYDSPIEFGLSCCC